MNVLGEIKLPIVIGNMLHYDIRVIVVKDPSFPGNLLIGYETMKKEDVTLFPARGGAEFSFLFVPFIREQPNIIATCEMSSVADNNVVERPSAKTNENTENSPSSPNKLSIPNKGKIIEDTPKPAQTLLLTTGHVTGSTLLHSMSVNKVTVKLKGVTSAREIISLPETTKLKGCYLESAVYMSNDGTVNVLLVNTLNKNLMLKSGTQIGSFQVCEQPIKIVNESEVDSVSEESFVCPIQSDTGDLEWKFWSHLKFIYQQNKK